MYRVIFDNDVGAREGTYPPLRYGDYFARVPLTSKEQEMARMTFDGLLLQSHLPENEVLSIDQIAKDMFTREGEEVGKVARNRAKQAALNLIALGNAKAIPNRREITHIKSTASCGAQLAAIFNLSIRRAEQNRRESDREEAESNGEPSKSAESQTPIVLQQPSIQ